MLVSPAGQPSRQAAGETAGEVTVQLYAVREAPTLDAARVAADQFINTYRQEYPAAIACFADDWDALPTHTATRRTGP